MRLSADVVILGAGITGLMQGVKLSALGFKCVVVERSGSVGAGATTRNEGWLHAGTYHAVSVREAGDARQVAKRCIYGHDFYSRWFPEALEEAHCPTVAFTTSRDRVEFIVGRWQLAGVHFESLSDQELTNLVPEIDTHSVAAAFLVRDTAINTRIVLAKLMTMLAASGGELLRGVERMGMTDSHTMRVSGSDGSYSLHAPLYIHAGGYAMGRSLTQLLGVSLPLRYWKSHLLLTPRLSHANVFSVDPGQAAMMNHGEVSVVGLNDDARECALPDFTPEPALVDEIVEQVQRRFKRGAGSGVQAVACTKVDLAPDTSRLRSLNIAVAEPLPDHLCVLPGKMTEVPFLADAVVRQVFDRLDRPRVTHRPCDAMRLGVSQ